MDDGRFEQRIRETLDAGLDTLDPAVTRRLRQARAAAVEQAGRRATRALRPAAALVLAGMLVAAVFLRPAGEGPELPAADPVDLEIIAADDSLRFYEELEFYQWLAEEAEADAG